MRASPEQFLAFVRFAECQHLRMLSGRNMQGSLALRINLRGYLMRMRQIACALICCVIATAAEAHRSTSEQDYSKYRQKNGASCCNGKDCRPVGYAVRPDGSVIMFPDGQGVVVEQRLLNEKPSDDGRAHWCGIVIPGASPVTFCAILPRQTTRWEKPSAPTRWLRKFAAGWNQLATPELIIGFVCGGGR
jgi:hypothetical protein